MNERCVQVELQRQTDLERALGAVFYNLGGISERQRSGRQGEVMPPPFCQLICTRLAQLRKQNMHQATTTNDEVWPKPESGADCYSREDLEVLFIEMASSVEERRDGVWAAQRGSASYIPLTHSIQGISE